MQKCTNKKVFKVAMEEVSMENDKIIILVDGNFLVDAVK
jgi:hypothetical protein